MVFTVYGICIARGLYVLPRAEPEKVHVYIRKPSKCTDFTYYNLPRSLRLLVATARSSRHTGVATAYDPHAILE